MKNLTPYVIDKTLQKNEFNPDLIYTSLLKETNISKENAKKVTEKVVRTIIGIGTNIKIITAPMIREIINSTLLQYGLEVERLQYTRIGFPVHDLTNLFDNGVSSKQEIDDKIVSHVKKEYNDVLDIIKKLEISNNE